MKKPSFPLMLLVALLISFNVFGSPILNSLPSAAATIYLDFDGYNVHCAYWNGGRQFTCDPSGMTDAEVTEVYNRVAEDFRPFDINITTDEAKFLAAPLSARIRVVVTPTSGWYTGVGGVSFIGSFKWGDDTPAFVFSDRLGPKNPKMIAECCSHESGHSVGLSHQSRYDGACSLTATYNDGEGVGEASWAPIMGNSYYRNMSGWNNGPTPYGCADKQDNLSIITTQNGFNYRMDDYSDDINNKPAKFEFSDTINGIISTNTDKDAFTFSLVQNSVIHISVRPFSVDASYEGANLDVKLSLYNSAKDLVRTFDPAHAMDVTIDTTLSKGTWYILVDGGGNTNMDGYGSLGSYSFSSSAIPVLPAWTVNLSGKADKNKHNLKWIITPGESIQLIAVESSGDGIHFNTVNTTGPGSKDFNYTPPQKTDLYYRIKAVSEFNQVVYSNTIMLQAVLNRVKQFIVSTFTRDHIIVIADENYGYMLTGINGNSIVKGNGNAGSNKLEMGGLPGGVYVLQLSGKNTKQTERIIKQ